MSAFCAPAPSNLATHLIAKTVRLHKKWNFSPLAVAIVIFVRCVDARIA